MINKIILGNLLVNPTFAQKVVPYLDHDYFEEPSEKISCKLITRFIKKYNNLPKKEALLADLSELPIKEETHTETFNFINNLVTEEQNLEWLLLETEKFCKDRALQNAVMRVVEKIEKDEAEGSDQILKEALAVSFDNHVGHDFFEDAEERWDHFEEERVLIPFDIDLLNQVTDGGLPRKNLMAILAPTGVGKSMAMCHMAAANIAAGYNVLYITLEMSEYRISRRIEANLFDLEIKDFKGYERGRLRKKLNTVKNKCHGRLITKEYPTGAAHTGHFRHLISELKLKKNFTPDVIYIDYLGICASSRRKGNVGMYELYKSIAEEIRALAIENNALAVTGLQVNRDGIKSANMSMTDVAESMGIIHALDFMIGIDTNEHMEAIQQLKVTLLKNRDGDTKPRSFAIGVDKSKMKIYNVDRENAILDDTEEVDRKEKIKNVFK